MFTFWTKPTEDYVSEAVHSVVAIHKAERDGDVLLFLPGREDIERAIELISTEEKNMQNMPVSLVAYPLYAGLHRDRQAYVFEPAPAKCRKVIVATNIAEASVTIEGIKFVIDSGFVKLHAFNPRTGIESLTTAPVSRAAAVQRCGRAGRTQPGKCYRLYTEGCFNDLPAHTLPEIQRSNLAPTVLHLKALGVDNLVRFEYLSPPPAELLMQALELLFWLGALDSDGNLTPTLGMGMAELALEPMMSKSLFSAPKMGCLNEMLSIAAMSSLEGDVWLTREGERKAFEAARANFAADEGDQITLLNVYQAYVNRGQRDAGWCKNNYLNVQSLQKATNIRRQLQRHMERYGYVEPQNVSMTRENISEQLCRCLAAGFFLHAAKMLPNGSFQSVNGAVLHPHPSSLLFVSAPTGMKAVSKKLESQCRMDCLQ